MDEILLADNDDNVMAMASPLIPAVAAAAARDHPYLPGNWHSLHVPTMAANPELHHHLVQRRGATMSLPVLEVPGVVLFPGARLPLRLHETCWVNYLRAQIEASLRFPQQARSIQIGVVPPIMKQTNDRTHQERRRSWTRTGHGPARLRRLSRQLLAELAEEDAEEAAEDTAPTVARTAVEEQRRPSVRRNSLPSRHLGPEEPLNERDPWIGRIGTVATILYTHEDEEDAAAAARRQLVVTVQGRERFVIVRREASNHQSSISRVEYTDVGVQVFLVRPLHEPPLPPIRLARYLATVSPIPGFVWNKYAATETVAQQVRDRLAQIPALTSAGSCAPQVPPSPPPPQPAEPLSYWLSGNLALSLVRRQQLLEMPRVMDRLQVLLFELQAYETVDEAPVIQCRYCQIPLASTAHIFTVTGAAGTTGAYVNEHGCVHQTTTVRQVDVDEIRLHGAPETKDTWFPGYSWTIMACGFCGMHLGWKFINETAVVASDNTPDRPPVFYGLSSSSINTVPSPQVMPRRHESIRWQLGAALNRQLGPSS